jgi:DivIVA domain
MEWLVWMVAVAILGLAAVAASGRLGEFPATVTDTPQPHVPGGSLTGADLRALRFAVVPRGYSMQQVDELLDRISHQLEQGSSVTASAEGALEAPVHAWVPVEAQWDEAEPVGHGAEVEPQPPLHDETEIPPLRAAEPPAAPSWQAAELVVAPDPRTEDPDPVAPAVDPVAPAVDPVAPVAEVVAPVAEVVGEPDAQPAPGDADPSAAADAQAGPAAPEPSEEPALAASVEVSESVADTPEPVVQLEAEQSVTPVAATKPRAKREPRTKAVPEPAVAAEGATDDLDDEIARIGAGQANAADYGAALDDLVSKYSFRKVEHWYELPGFDLPAPATPGPGDETAEPTQESTSADS